MKRAAIFLAAMVGAASAAPVQGHEMTYLGGSDATFAGVVRLALRNAYETEADFTLEVVDHRTGELIPEDRWRSDLPEGDRVTLRPGGEIEFRAQLKYGGTYQVCSVADRPGFVTRICAPVRHRFGEIPPPITFNDLEGSE